MTPTADPLRRAAVALLTAGDGAAALVAAGVAAPEAGGVAVEPAQGAALPYVEVQGTTEVEGGRSDTTRQTSVTLTLVVRADKLGPAEAVARALVDVLGRRFPVAAAGDDAEIQVLSASIDLYGPAVQDPPPGRRPWGLPVRFRYQLSQPAPASE